MIIALVSIFVILLAGLWFVDGVFNRRLDECDRELQDYYESEADRDD